MGDAVGAMRERLVLKQNVWPTLTAAIVRSGTLAIATTVVAHGYAVGDYVTVSGATVTGYNGKVKLTAVTTLTFSYPVDGSLATPAAGAITAVYVSDAQGGRRSNWVTVTTLWAEQLAGGTGGERLQAAAVQALSNFAFRVRIRTDLSPKMRLEWTPRWPPNASTEALEISTVDPWPEDPTAYHVLGCTEVVTG